MSEEIKIVHGGRMCGNVYQEYLKIVKESQKLNNILNELESWLEEKYNLIANVLSKSNKDFNLIYLQELSTYKDVLDKLKELKGDDK